jgi:hypothetical protein
MMTKTISRAAVAAACVVAVTFGAGGAVSAKGDGSANAKVCQNGGFANWTQEDGTTFANTGACVSHAAKGGKLVEVELVAVEPPSPPVESAPAAPTEPCTDSFWSGYWTWIDGGWYWTWVWNQGDCGFTVS